MASNKHLFLKLSVVAGILIAQVLADEPGTQECLDALERNPKPDITMTAKHLWNPCSELCRNSSGQFPTGQFPHPWDCNAFINCFENDAWVHWCQEGLQFNEKNMQCDWPRNVNCVIRPRPTPAPKVKPIEEPEKCADGDSLTTCKDSNTNLNEKEYLGFRPDLCKDGSGNYRTPDCRFYVKCIGSQAYVARCPAGFLFDPVPKQCDWPKADSDCFRSCSGRYDITSKCHKRQDQTTPSPTVVPVTTAATTQKLVATTLTPHEQVKVENLTCNESHCIPKAGCQPELCKQKIGHFAVPGKCEKFANCWDSCAYVTDCPESMVFSESKGMCDLPWNLPENDPCHASSAGVPTALPMISLKPLQGFSQSQMQTMS